MSTFKILWNMTWRGTRGGLLYGGASGIIYGLFVPIAFSAIVILLSKPFQAPGISGISSLLIILSIVLLFGGAIGGLTGGPLGFASGFVGGLLLGLLTRLRFFPLRDEESYHRVVQVGSGVFGLITGLIGFTLLPIGFLKPLQTPIEFIRSYPYLFPYNQGFISVVLIIIMPTMIVMYCAMKIGMQIVNWYENETRGAIANA